MDGILFAAGGYADMILKQIVATCCRSMNQVTIREGPHLTSRVHTEAPGGACGFSAHSEPDNAMITSLALE